MTSITTEKTIYQLNVFFRDSQVNLFMYFRDMETAKSTASDMLGKTHRKIMVSDHFGHEAYLDTGDVIMAIATDLKRELAAHEEVKILQAIAQVKLQNRAEAEPLLKFLSGNRVIN